MAELQIGVYPKSSSQVLGANGQMVALRDVIEHDKSALLGEVVAQRFGELPFLFRVLCAAQPPSTQAHPSKHNPEIGFAKENAAGTPMSATECNCKDPSHELELVFALTPFLTMNTLREFSDIAALLQSIPAAHSAIVYFLEEPSIGRLSYLFASSLNIQGEGKSYALVILKSVLNNQQGEPWQTTRLVADVYPSDSGLFSSLLLNMVKPNPGEAIFLFVETPRAYLQGMAFEVMANLGNVLYIGPTLEYIDISELVANVKPVARPADQLLTASVESDGELDFPIPVNDFAFFLHELTASGADISQQSMTTLFYIEGETVLSRGEQHLALQPGESASIGANESLINISGTGRLARIHDKLQQDIDTFNNFC